MKKFLKIVRVLFLGAIGIGVIWYFQSLKIDGDPLLTACWGVEVYDDVTGEKVVGVEDLDFDPESGTIFMSAYDRRAVAREIDEGKVTTQGGIYTINVLDITDATSLQVTDISRDFKEAGNEFRPHGIWVGSSKEGIRVIAINRKYERRLEDVILVPSFESFSSAFGKMTHVGDVSFEGVCNPNDLAIAYILIFTDLTGNCSGSWFGTGGVVKANNGNETSTVVENLSFPNGIVITKNLMAVSLTTKNIIQFQFNQNKTSKENIKLPIAPDNLTVDQDDNLYVAGFPNLIDYYFYMNGWFGVEKSPSAAYRISPEDYALELLFKDNGTMISGATVALRAGDYLILGSGWDDNIAICSGMDEFD